MEKLKIAFPEAYQRCVETNPESSRLFSIKKKVCVVSDHIEEIRDYVINVMHSGATFYEATGAFDYRNYKELNIIVNRQEYVTLINLIDKVDPDAFVSVYNVSEIMSHTWGRKGGSQNASGK